MASSWRQQLDELGDDLCTREINLISAPGGMSAEPMPEPFAALAEVAEIYVEHLGLRGQVSVGTQPSREELISAFAAIDTRVTTLSSIAGSRVVMRANEAQEGTAASDRVILRVKGHTAEIRKILASRPTGGFTAREIGAIRKAWELGVDTVVLQTTIGLDGDVITRVHARYASVEHQSLFLIHEGSVTAAVRTWSDVVGAAIDLVSKLFRTTKRAARLE